MFELTRKQRHLLFFVVWALAFIAIGMFGEWIANYLKYILHASPLRPLMSSAGIFVMVVLVAVCMHHVTHRLTSTGKE